MKKIYQTPATDIVLVQSVGTLLTGSFVEDTDKNLSVTLSNEEGSFGSGGINARHSSIWDEEE